MQLSLTLPPPDLLWTYFKWLIIAVIWGMLAFGLRREGQQLRRMQARKADASEMAALLQMLHQRNLQTGILLLLLIIVVAVNDLRQETAAHPATPSASAHNTSDDVSAILEKGTEKLPAAANMPYSDITEFNEKDSRRQAYLDWLKERYENWLISYYYLQRCGTATLKDMETIRLGLRRELASVHADASVEDNIFMAANGSYNEMYRSIPCDKQHLSQTKATYDANMQQLQAAKTSSAEPANP